MAAELGLFPPHGLNWQREFGQLFEARAPQSSQGKPYDAFRLFNPQYDHSNPDSPELEKISKVYAGFVFRKDSSRIPPQQQQQQQPSSQKQQSAGSGSGGPPQQQTVPALGQKRRAEEQGSRSGEPEKKRHVEVHAVRNGGGGSGGGGGGAAAAACGGVGSGGGSGSATARRRLSIGASTPSSGKRRAADTRERVPKRARAEVFRIRVGDGKIMVQIKGDASLTLQDLVKVVIQRFRMGGTAAPALTYTDGGDVIEIRGQECWEECIRTRTGDCIRLAVRFA